MDGDVLPQVEGFRYSDAPKTLLLFVSTQCRFCTESMPFYKRLSTGKGRGTFQFVVVGAEPVNTLREYIGDFAVEPDRIITVSRGLFEVSATPTAIVADGTGRVRGYWRGLLRDRERELEAALRQ